MQRVFHPVAVHFKGSGFYNTDYGKGKSKAASEAASKPESKEGSSSTSDVERAPRRRRSDDEQQAGRQSELRRLVRPSSSLSHRVALRAVRDEQVAAVVAAGGLEHLGVARVAGGHVGEQRHQLEAVHVRLERRAARSSSPRAAGRTCWATSPASRSRRSTSCWRRGAVAVVLVRARTRFLRTRAVAERARAVQVELALA